MDPIQICNALGKKTCYQIVKSLKNHSIATCCNRIEYHENGVSVGDVVKLTGLAQSTVSQHLAVLEKAELVLKEKRDLWTCYFLNTQVINDYLNTISQDLSGLDS